MGKDKYSIPDSNSNKNYFWLRRNNPCDVNDFRRAWNKCTEMNRVTKIEDSNGIPFYINGPI